ncbi:hypothetical protein KIM372_11980 [Bombiscardovia nodaiensis]|uniref:Uncharacterized protein n=1 Tax=Bombiscardovia nodaiensis TaxID=2932181 RepID=A0ABM8B8S3_9BIFI|nr:hypothetical protein KIM372_11980 [Bombiscardovia nodaiensis]
MKKQHCFNFSLAIVAIMSILALLACVIAPVRASAAPNDSYSNSTNTPAYFGGRLHGKKTSTEIIEGKGTVTVTIDYDEGNVDIISFDGSRKHTSLYTLTSQISTQLNSSP